jgi:hypothetical protein
VDALNKCEEKYASILNKEGIWKKFFTQLPNTEKSYYQRF